MILSPFPPEGHLALSGAMFLLSQLGVLLTSSEYKSRMLLNTRRARTAPTAFTHSRRLILLRWRNAGLRQGRVHGGSHTWATSSRPPNLENCSMGCCPELFTGGEGTSSMHSPSIYPGTHSELCGTRQCLSDNYFHHVLSLFFSLCKAI